MNLSSSDLRAALLAEQRTARGALCVCALALSGCSLSSADGQAAFVDPSDVQDGDNASLAFEQQGVLTLAPAEIATVSVRTDPPDAYELSFLLVGNSLDASLDVTTTITDRNTGVASTSLRAPNGATNFLLRAALDGGASADLQVSVSDEGFGTIAVEPSYYGTRPVEEWSAAVLTGTTCAELEPTFPEDPVGTVPTVAQPDTPLEVVDVPVGPNAAVFVRAGHYMWGCSDESNLAAGQTAHVVVPVVDKPIDTSDIDLTLELEFEPDLEPFEAMLAQGETSIIDSYAAVLDSEPKTLLAEMMALSSDPEAFQQASTDNGWEQSLTTHLAMQPTIAQIIAGLADQGGALQAPLIIGHLGSVGADAEHALYGLESFGALEAADAGVPQEYLLALTVDPDDKVRVGGSLFWMPSRYVGAAVTMASQMGGASDAADAIGAAIQCDAVDLQGMAGCDASCIATLCHDAVAALWADALDASATQGQFGEVALQATGPAQFDDEAGLVGFEGSWLGEVTVGQLSAGVMGGASANLTGPDTTR